MEETMNWIFLNRHIFIALATSLIGTATRVSYENEMKTISRKKVFSYFTASFFVAYIIYEALRYYELQPLTGLACAVGGLVSIDIIKLLIEEVPKLIRRRLNNNPNNPNNDN